MSRVQSQGCLDDEVVCVAVAVIETRPFKFLGRDRENSRPLLLLLLLLSQSLSRARAPGSVTLKMYRGRTAACCRSCRRHCALAAASVLLLNGYPSSPTPTDKGDPGLPLSHSFPSETREKERERHKSASCNFTALQCRSRQQPKRRVCQITFLDSQNSFRLLL